MDCYLHAFLLLSSILHKLKAKMDDKSRHEVLPPSGNYFMGASLITPKKFPFPGSRQMAIFIH